jgi:glycosyltransferase EpsH
MSGLNVDISIIVPVYNVEKYVGRCLDSILNQKFSGTFEVIAVDDGSTDSSLNVLKEYQVKDVRLKVIEHMTNKKLSIARATGMKASNGVYLMHVDSDDWLLPNALERLYAKCIESDADILVFNYIKENESGARKYIWEIKQEILSENKLEVQRCFYGASWSKIVKKSLTDNLTSGTIGVNMTEDLLYATEILLKAQKICLTPEFYYVYFDNSKSLTNSNKSLPYIQNQVVILSQLQNIIKRYNADLKFSNNVVNYFEKWIYLELAKLHFWYNRDLDNGDFILQEFSQFSIFTPRIKRLRMSLTNRFICLLEVASCFNLRIVLGILKNSYRKN